MSGVRFSDPPTIGDCVEGCTGAKRCGAGEGAERPVGIEKNSGCRAVSANKQSVSGGIRWLERGAPARGGTAGGKATGRKEDSGGTGGTKASKGSAF